MPTITNLSWNIMEKLKSASCNSQVHQIPTAFWMLKKHPKLPGQRHVPLSSMKVAEIRMRPPPAPRLFGAPVPAKGIPTPQKMGGAYFAPHMLHLGTSWIFHTSKIPHLLPAARPSCHGAKGSPWTKAKRRVSWASSVQPLAVPASHQGSSRHIPYPQWAPGEFASLSRNANLCRIWSIVNSMTSYSLTKSRSITPHSKSKKLHVEVWNCNTSSKGVRF